MVRYKVNLQKTGKKIKMFKKKFKSSFHIESVDEKER